MIEAVMCEFQSLEAFIQFPVLTFCGLKMLLAMMIQTTRKTGTTSNSTDTACSGSVNVTITTYFLVISIYLIIKDLRTPVIL